MSLVPQSAVLVLRGNFNPYVLSPDWLKEHEFAETVERVSLTLGGIQDGIRFSIDGIEWIVDHSTVRFIAKGFDERISTFGKKLLDLLPHTPIRAVGFIFSYKSSAEISDLEPSIHGEKVSSVFSDVPEVGPPDLVKWGMVSRLDQTRIELALTSGSSGVTANINFHTNVGETSPVGSAGDAKECCDSYSKYLALSNALLEKTLPEKC